MSSRSNVSARTSAAGTRARPAARRVPKLDRTSPLYHATARNVDIVTVPSMHYLMIDGAGDPNSAPEFQEAVKALYSVAYALRSLLKGRGETDYSVMPLEGLWWTDVDRPPLATLDKASWRWTLMIAQPVAVSRGLLEEARTAAVATGIAAATRLRLTTLREGRAAQMLHVGPYATEGSTIERIHRAIADLHRHPAGKHHEIYLGDPRRSAPEKLRTIVRQPFA